MKLSGKDLAEEIGCARSTLSEATDKGYLVNDRWDVQAWAVCGPSGRLKHYEVPEQVAFLNAEGRQNRAEDPNSADSAPVATSEDSTAQQSGLTDFMEQYVEEEQQTTRTVAEEAGDTTQLVSDETDVAGTARNAGMAYVAGKAVENETAGARAFWTIGSALVGGWGGHEVSDGNPWAAMIGAAVFGSAGYLAYEQQPRQQESVGRTQQMRSRQSRQIEGSTDQRRSGRLSQTQE